ncbi:hypothetical protein Aduo_015774 [Ancylostoma duodenale]
MGSLIAMLWDEKSNTKDLRTHLRINWGDTALPNEEDGKWKTLVTLLEAMKLLAKFKDNLPFTQRIKEPLGRVHVTKECGEMCNDSPINTEFAPAIP